jgi:hypothetical protein
MVPKRVAGPPKGTPKPPGSGRRAGTPNRETQFRQTILQQAIEEVFAEVSDEQVEKLSPLRLIMMCMWAAVRARNAQAALVAARECLPYFHTKLLAKEIDPDQTPEVIIEGGNGLPANF